MTPRNILPIGPNVQCLSLSYKQTDAMETNMLIRTGLWSLEEAKLWLRNYDWGAVIADTIEEHPEPRRRVAWICMVMDMEAVMSGEGAIGPASIVAHRDARPDEGDVRLAAPRAAFD